MAKLHALLIAINNYHPASGVTGLAGCINDRNAMRDFLKKHYSDLDPQISMLTDAEATRTNVIRTFRDRLAKKAKKGDTVLLFYAGHGSYSASASSFAKFDGIGQDETFVCYDSRVIGNHDLTDKELAVLLSEIKEGVHTVVIADSCHSASITRTIGFERNPAEDAAATFNLGNKRFFQGRATSRNLSSYLLEADNYYTKLGENISIPRSKHLLMSACSRNEEAWETTNRRGLFTTTLLSVLKENPNISYRNLFAKVRAIVYGTAKNQQPTLYPLEGFNPNAIFLRPTIKPNLRRHQIKEETSGDWRMGLGAINGLPTSKAGIAQLVIGIYDGFDENAKLVATSKVANMQIADLSLENTNKLKANKTYWGTIESLPTEVIFNVTGRRRRIKGFLEDYDKTPSPFVQLIPKFKSAEYSLHITKRKLSLRVTKTKKEIIALKNEGEESLKLLNKHLKHIADWENIANLEHKTSTIKDSLEVAFLEEKEENKFENHEGSVVTLDYSPNPDGSPKGIWYQIKAQNNSDKDLYVTLLHLNANFGIAAHFPCELIPAGSGWKVLDDQHALYIEDKNAVQVTDIFKVIISTTRFDEHKYLLEDIEPTSRGVMTRDNSSRNKDDWYTHTITVNTILEQGAINKSRSIDLEGISIEPHPNFQAEVSVNAIQNNTRSTHPGSSLSTIFQGAGASVLNLTKPGTRSANQNRSIIELTDIQHPESLADNPLVMKLEGDHGDGNVIPVTMKNGFIVPLGTSVQLADGSTQISIDHIPEGTDPAPSSQGKRSLGRALWFSLLKLAGIEEEAFLLRKVVYRNNEPKRVLLNEINIKMAKNILLVIHGIIGDTKGMISNLAFLKEEKHYDLILTFDYENLNTKIEDIATKLNEQLESFGLGADDGKSFDILAHSMGGLVSRHLIEFIREGDNMVDRLFMFGTPNGGSIFGEIPIYRDKLVKLLSVGLNFGKAWMGWVGTALGVVNKILIGSKTVTITLGQMSSSSPFIENLQGGEKGHTKYTVIAGDISDYKNVKNARFARFVEAVLLKIGETANSNEPNDIAVLVEDIRAVPEVIGALKYDVCCHHMNYFESEEGLIALREVVVRS